MFLLRYLMCGCLLGITPGYLTVGICWISDSQCTVTGREGEFVQQLLSQCGGMAWLGDPSLRHTSMLLGR